jgi:hypothetical protein
LAVRYAPLVVLLVVGCAGAPDTPTAVPTTPDSRATILAGEYALTIMLDEGCTQLPADTWSYRATLWNSGRYLDVSVTGPGFTERTGVGQMYTYDDFTARFIWNFNDPEFDYPDPRIAGPRLLLYGASETKIRNGSVSGTIRGMVSTTLDFNRQCYGTHRFSLISTEGKPAL